jgi:hypothetical protein
MARSLRRNHMARSFRIVLALTLLTVLTVGLASNAMAGGRKVLDSTMAALLTPGQVIDGVTGAGAPWSIDQGRAVLFADGRVHVEVEGLILTALGRNPASTGKVRVSCNGLPVAETATVPFSPEGDAEVDAVVSLPSPCFGPSIFFTSAGGSWFAVTGF